MPFLQQRAPRHGCDLPPIRRWVRRWRFGSLPVGTQWQCPECQRIWEVTKERMRATDSSARRWDLVVTQETLPQVPAGPGLGAYVPAPEEKRS